MREGGGEYFLHSLWINQQLQISIIVLRNRAHINQNNYDIILHTCIPMNIEQCKSLLAARIRLLNSKHTNIESLVFHAQAKSFDTFSAVRMRKYVQILLDQGFEDTAINYSDRTVLVDYLKTMRSGIENSSSLIALYQDPKFTAVLWIQQVLDPNYNFDNVVYIWDQLKKLVSSNELLYLLQDHNVLLRFILSLRFEDEDEHNYLESSKILNFLICNYPTSYNESYLINNIERYIPYYEKIGACEYIYDSMRVASLSKSISAFMGYCRFDKVGNRVHYPFRINILEHNPNMFNDYDFMNIKWTREEKQQLCIRFKDVWLINLHSAQRLFSWSFVPEDQIENIKQQFSSNISKFIFNSSKIACDRALFCIDNKIINVEDMKCIDISYPILNNISHPLVSKHWIDSYRNERLFKYILDNMCIPESIQIYFIISFRYNIKCMQYFVDNFTFNKRLLSYCIQELKYALIKEQNRVDSDILPLPSYNISRKCMVDDYDVIVTPTMQGYESSTAINECIIEILKKAIN